MTTNSRTIRKALTKLLMAVILFSGLIVSCFIHGAEEFKGLIIFFIVILVFPITLLLAVDASRAIRNQLPSHKSLRVLGSLLVFPQAVIGTILVGFAVVYPLIGITETMEDMAKGVLPIRPVAGIFISMLAFVVGLRYIREGLGIRRRNS